MSRKRAITTFLLGKFMITRSSIPFQDFLGSSIAPQVMPPWQCLTCCGFFNYFDKAINSQVINAFAMPLYIRSIHRVVFLQTWDSTLWTGSLTVWCFQLVSVERSAPTNLSESPASQSSVLINKTMKWLFILMFTLIRFIYRKDKISRYLFLNHQLRVCRLKVLFWVAR